MRSLTHYFVRCSPVVILLSACGTRSALHPAAKLDGGRVAADLRRLDRLERTFVETQERGDQFGETFALASKRLADARGVEIIHAVMHRARAWKGEEGMVFAPLIDFLPRQPAVELLRRYQQLPHTSEQEKIWAKEYLTEFEMEDTREMVRRYSGRK